jgi:hypothetical protein
MSPLVVWYAEVSPKSGFTSSQRPSQLPPPRVVAAGALCRQTSPCRFAVWTSRSAW